VDESSKSRRVEIWEFREDHHMPIRIFFIVSAVVCLAPAFVWAAVQTTLYVVPGGSDDNPGTEAKPFATLDKARQAVRTLNRDMAGDIVVVLRGGIYRIDHGIVFDAEDSGNNGYHVVYRAQAGETPIISGGKPVVGWQPDEKGRWKAPAPIGSFRQLYVNGKHATRAQGKAPTGLEFSGEHGYRTTDVATADWKNPSDLELCYQIGWTHTRLKVQSIKREGDHAIIAMLEPHFNYAKLKEGVNIGGVNGDLTFNPKLDSVYLENALELLDEPGEWYLDRKAKTVYYMPRPGEDMTKVEAIAPAVERLVELRGTLDRPVHNIQFVGITFEHGSWLRPSEIGLVDAQANFILDGKKLQKRKQGNLEGLGVVHNEYLKSPSNIICHAAKSIRFERCTFAKLGSGGIDLEFGAQDNAILGCRFYDVSGTAVQVGDVLKVDHHPDDPRQIVKNNRVENCYIHDCGIDYMDSPGVFAGYTEGTIIAHNEITQLPSVGIHVGWGWGEEDAGGTPDYYQPFRYNTPTSAKNNRIEYNHIHRVLTKLDDGGSIYTLGNMPGTVIRGNYIHDNPFPERSRRWGGRGIYLDEGSGFIEVTGNLVLRSPNPMFFHNMPQNRDATCKEHGNLIDVNPPEAKPIVDRAGLEPAYRDLPSHPQ
jgi:hypothetical protein